MNRLSTLVAAAAIGQLVGLLGWIDPLFVPLVLAGPLVSGAVAAGRRVALSWVVVLWVSAGLDMTWTDWVVNHEDVAFHLVLSVVMPLLATVGFGAARLTARVRA